MLTAIAPDQSMKRAYLVVYDYGTGGLWAIIMARSAAEIRARFPTLKIVEDRPKWMSAVDYESICTTNCVDIDDAPSGWLSELPRRSNSPR